MFKRHGCCFTSEMPPPNGAKYIKTYSERARLHSRLSYKCMQIIGIFFGLSVSLGRKLSWDHRLASSTLVHNPVCGSGNVVLTRWHYKGRVRQFLQSYANDHNALRPFSNSPGGVSQPNPRTAFEAVLPPRDSSENWNTNTKNVLWEES